MKRVIKLLGICLLATIGFASCGSDDGDYYINAMSNNEQWGTVSGGGTYHAGDQATLTANAKEGCRFLRWDDGVTDNPRTFTVEESKIITAYFGVIPEGDGTTTVSWKGDIWTAGAVYAVSKNMASNVVTLEIYQDPNDPTKPMVVCQFKMEAGEYVMAQDNSDLLVLPFDYPEQTGNYQGQQIPPYQPAQGSYMVVEACDPISGIVTGYMEGQYVNVEQYAAGDQTMYPLRIDFSATQWIDYTK